MVEDHSGTTQVLPRRSVWKVEFNLYSKQTRCLLRISNNQLKTTANSPHGGGNIARGMVEDHSGTTQVLPRRSVWKVEFNLYSKQTRCLLRISNNQLKTTANSPHGGGNIAREEDKVFSGIVKKLP